MDILNWLYLVKNKITRTTVENSATDLVMLAADVSFQKRGDKYQSYAMTVDDFAASLPAPQPDVDAEGNVIVTNSSTYTVNVGPGGEHLIPNFSGMLLVNDHYDGAVELWIAGGGDTVSVAGTNTGGGPVLSTLTIDGTGYTWTNVGNLTGPFTFTVIKTRNEA